MSARVNGTQRWELTCEYWIVRPWFGKPECQARVLRGLRLWRGGIIRPALGSGASGMRVVPCSCRSSGWLCSMIRLKPAQMLSIFLYASCIVAR